MSPSLPGTVAGLATLAVTAAALTVPSAAAGPDAKATAAPAVAKTTTSPCSPATSSPSPTPVQAPTSASVDRAPGSAGGYQTYTVGDDLHVVPDAALPFLANGRVDADLFNVTGLVEQGYDDVSAPSIPLIVQYGPGVRAAAVDAPAHSTQGAVLPSIHGAAIAASKEDATDFWDDLANERRPASPAASPDPPRRQGPGHARPTRRADRRPRGVGGRASTATASPSPCSTPASTRPTPTSPAGWPRPAASCRARTVDRPSTATAPTSPRRWPAPAPPPTARRRASPPARTCSIGKVLGDEGSGAGLAGSSRAWSGPRAPRRRRLDEPRQPGGQRRHRPDGLAVDTLSE